VHDHGDGERAGAAAGVGIAQRSAQAVKGGRLGENSGHAQDMDEAGARFK
jgi:hypothetical protein